MDTDALPDTLRIILVGKTHAGKSSTGNTICGKEAFKIKTTEMDASKCICMERTNVCGQPLSIVDTPGLFDPIRSNEEVKRAIANGVVLSHPGPHVILVIIRPGKFTNEEQEAVRILQTIFGEKAAHYTMALFTCGDDLEADGVVIEDVIHQSSHLRTFINQCDGGYHVFNNRVKDPSQVRELLEKINALVRMNGWSYYTMDLPPEYQDGFSAAFPIGRAIGGAGAAAAVAAGGLVGTLVAVDTGGAVVFAVTVGFAVCVGSAAAVLAFAAVGAAVGGAASVLKENGGVELAVAARTAAGAVSGIASGAASVGAVAVKAAGAAGMCGAVVAAGAPAVVAAVEAEIVAVVGVAAAVAAVQTAIGAVKTAAAAVSAVRAAAARRMAPSTEAAIKVAQDAVAGVTVGAAGGVFVAFIAVARDVLSFVGAFGTTDKILSVAYAAVTAILPVAYLTKTLWLNRNN